MRSRQGTLRCLGRRLAKHGWLMLAVSSSLCALTILLPPMLSAYASTAPYELY
jgi:hypothetical protein